MTIALTLLAAGITGAVLLLGGTGLSGSRSLVGVMLAVVGLGLVVGAFVRGGHGLILLALPLLVAAWGISRGPLQPWQGAGELRVRPTSVDQVAGGYDRTFGRVELDLRMLDLDTPAAAPPTASSTTPPDPTAPPVPATPQPPGVATAVPPPEPVRTRVSVQLGEAVVRVPPNADVRVRCHAAVGDVECLGAPAVRSGDGLVREGPTAHAEVESLGEDGVVGGRPLELDVTVGTGSVEVRRG